MSRIKFARSNDPRIKTLLNTSKNQTTTSNAIIPEVKCARMVREGGEGGGGKSGTGRGSERRKKRLNIQRTDVNCEIRRLHYNDLREIARN